MWTYRVLPFVLKMGEVRIVTFVLAKVTKTISIRKTRHIPIFDLLIAETFLFYAVLTRTVADGFLRVANIYFVLKI